MSRTMELVCVTAFGVCAVLLSPWWWIGVVVTLAYVARVELAPRDIPAPVERDAERDTPRDVTRDVGRERDRA